CLPHPSPQKIITDDIGIRKEERRKSVGVVHHLTFLHLEAKQIQEDCTIALILLLRAWNCLMPLSRPKANLTSWLSWRHLPLSIVKPKAEKVIDPDWCKLHEKWMLDD
ncbi:unnamed protein product, partial [Brassica rapa subsp. trilocularis]